MSRLLPFILSYFICISAKANETPYVYSFFVNSRMEGNYFYSGVDYEGNSWVKNIRKKLPVNAKQFFTPGNALELEFVNGDAGSWSVEIEKAVIRGQDRFVNPVRLSFRMFIASRNTSIDNLPKIQLGNKDSLYKAVNLSNAYGEIKGVQWFEVSIPLTELGITTVTNLDKEVTRLRFFQNDIDGERHIILIDDVELLPEKSRSSITANPSILSAKGFERHVDLTWSPVTDPSVKYIKIYRREREGEFRPVGIQIPQISRYADYTGIPGREYQYRISFLDHNYSETTTSPIVAASTRPMSDEELLTMVQEAAFRYYWEGAEPNSGLALENIPGRKTMIATGASGFGMMAIIAAVNRGFITREQAAERFLIMINFLKKSDTFHGAFPHFLDGTTGKTVPFFGARDNGADLVETSFLMQGLLTAREYFDSNSATEQLIVKSINEIWEKIEWSWFKQTPDSKFLYWHWSPDRHWEINHRLIGWNETMITYLMAIGAPKFSVPAEMYYTGWANTDSIGKAYRMNWGKTDHGSHYQNGNHYYGVELPVGVNNGGPLFFIHYSFMGPDPKQITDKYTNYFYNNRNIALINYRYCLENPKNFEGYGEGVWGLTASDGPYRYSANEPMEHQDRGKIAPTGAIASMPYLPEESISALKTYYRKYGHFLWGEYGFRDAFSLEDNWCSDIYMGLNQAPMVVMIENYRTGFIWKTFMKSPEIRKALHLIQESDNIMQ